MSTAAWMRRQRDRPIAEHERRTAMAAVVVILGAVTVLLTLTQPASQARYPARNTSLSPPPAAAESHTAPRTLVTLAPGAVANALLRIVHAVNFPAAKCHLVTADYLQIYPPNQTTPVYLHYTSQTCAKRVQILTIGVVQAGSGGQ